MFRRFEMCGKQDSKKESSSKNGRNSRDHGKAFCKGVDSKSSNRVEESNNIFLDSDKVKEVSRGKQPEVREKDLYYSFSRASSPKELQQNLGQLVEYCCSLQDRSPLPKIDVKQQLGNYRLVSYLGNGDFGHVFLSEHINSGEQVAVKVLRPSKGWIDKKHIEEFCQEIEKLTHFNHPNIVHLLGFGSKDKVPFFVMEYASGETLKNKIPSSPEETIKLVKQAACGIGHMHSRGFMHRDIKPANLLLGEKGEVLVGDLGVAALVGTTGSDGSYNYMAPEQKKGKPCPASDQYALATVAHQLLSEELPRRRAWYQICWDTLDKTSGISSKIRSPKIRQALSRGLHENWRKRFPNVGAFAQAFEQACREQPQQQPLKEWKRYVLELLRLSK